MADKDDNADAWTCIILYTYNVLKSAAEPGGINYMLLHQTKSVITKNKC